MKPHVRDKNYMESANCSELLSAGTDMHYFYSGGGGEEKKNRKNTEEKAAYV